MTRKKQSFVAQVAAGKNLVYDLRFTFPDGRKAYYYARIDPPKKQAFLRALESKTGVMDFSLYGELLEYGYGSPSAELLAEMKEKHNIIYDE